MAGFAFDYDDAEVYGYDEHYDPQLELDPEVELEGHLEDQAFEREEAARQARIAAGVEHACAGCGCSESRACEGGCVWATATLCSRCVR